jgi:antitoxin component of RelBE/YafQ-DinJ toxin-antitoxin module
MPEDRLNIRLDAVTKHDLTELAKRLNITLTDVVRLALREAAERRGILLLGDGDDGDGTA